MRNTRSVARLAKALLMAAATAVVCSAQMPPVDSGNYSAKVIEMTGRVSVLRDATAWALNVGDLVQVQELILTGADGQARFQVSDGSTFDVYPNSRVVFRKNPPNWRDLLDVLVGRVRVHIQHLYGPNPNRVQTPTAVISVRGTTFDVAVDDDDEATTVEVEEGLVEVQHALLPGSGGKLLSTGETLKVYRNVPIASSGIDKGDVFRRSVRMIADAMSTLEARMSRGGSISVGGGTTGSATSGGSGDSGGSKLPAPPPAPAPPPPVGAPPPAPAPPGFVNTPNGLAVRVLVVRRPETRFQKFRYAVWNTMLRMAFGPDPGAEIRRAVQNY